METMPLHSTRARDGFQSVASGTPMATRPRSPSPHEPTLTEALKDLPGWVVIAGGGFVAAIVGAMLGGALHI